MFSIKPLVSICIPTYNGAKFIEEALNSAINQTYKNLEIIVSDDKSSDDTVLIIKDKLIDSKIPYYIYTHNPKGIGANWNHCVEKSNGHFIKFLFQDDVLRNDCIEKMVNLALKDDKVGLIYCKRTILYNINNIDHKKWIDHCGVLHKKWFKIKVQQGILDGRKYLSDLYLLNDSSNKIGEPTAVLIKKTYFEKTGPFNENLKQTLDIEYWYRLMKYCKVGFVDENLVSFRLHDDQASFVNVKNEIDEQHLLNKKFYKTIFWQLHPQKRWKLFKGYSWIGDFVRFCKKKNK